MIQDAVQFSDGDDDTSGGVMPTAEERDPSKVA